EDRQQSSEEGRVKRENKGKRYIYSAIGCQVRQNQGLATVRSWTPKLLIFK
ncbi:hypothetical protein LCGC14_3125960, partial [marine sediment metagenome]